MWWAIAAAAAADECAMVSKGDITSVPSPSILVLGERKAHQPDLKRAAQVVTTLARRGPVTLALEAVHRDAQPVLDGFERGQGEAAELPELLGWSAHWDFPYEPYATLVTASLLGVHVVAVGQALGSRPPDEKVPLPPGYVNLLSSAMGDHPVPVEMEGQLVEAMAWHDFAIARSALAGWDGNGTLVILADRFHVEGGLGVSWQVQRLTRVPVSAAILVGADPPCFPGDRIWP